MDGAEKIVPGVSVEDSDSVYLDVQAAIGVAKHLGGLDASSELADICNAASADEVLDVGCGTGKTACFLVSNYGCRVIAVDINGLMIQRGKERAEREELDDSIEFGLADASNLPFEEGRFDAVIVESVTAFVEDKLKAVREYVRVAKPGGYIGLNETTWIEGSPPAELREYIFRTTGARPETPESWMSMLDSAGLRELTASVHRVSMLSEWANEMKWLDLRDLLGPWLRVIPQLLRSPETREFIRGLWPQPEDYFEYFGYGIYAGVKG